MTEDKDSSVQPESLVVRESSPDEAVQQEPWSELLSLERERIEHERQRVDLGRQVIVAGDAADKRQYEYHVEKLRRDDDDRKKRRRFGMPLIWALLAVAVAYAGFGLYFLFLGDEVQRSSATYLLLGASAIAGGYGLLAAIVRGFDHLFGR